MAHPGGGADSDEVSEALAALNAARGRFIAVAGHELRTPVTTLRGLAEELVRAVDPPDADELAELAPAILRSARRVEVLLDDLLLATDITTGEAVVFGAGVTLDYELTRALRLSGGGTFYRQAFDNRPSSIDWSQKRGWLGIEWSFGRDPGEETLQP